MIFPAVGKQRNIYREHNVSAKNFFQFHNPGPYCNYLKYCYIKLHLKLNFMEMRPYLIDYMTITSYLMSTVKSKFVLN